MNDLVDAVCAACHATADDVRSELTHAWAVQHARDTGHTVTVEVTHTYTVTAKDAEVSRRRDYLHHHRGEN